MEKKRTTEKEFKKGDEMMKRGVRVVSPKSMQQREIEGARLSVALRTCSLMLKRAGASF